MDFGFTPQQRQLWDDTLQFARHQLCHDDLIERDKHGLFSEDNWQQCAKQGLLGLCVPPPYGGAGYDFVTTIHALEALGYGCGDNGLTLAINGQVWSITMPIVRFGTEAQKQRYLPNLIAGRIKGAHAMTEPESGSDAFSLTTTAQKTDGGYLLNGQKILVGMAPVADFAVLMATLNPALGRWGVTAFLVDLKVAGVHVEQRTDKLGLRTEPHGSITLTNVFVPKENLLGKDGAGAAIFHGSMSYERSFIFTSHVGAMARQLDEAVAFVTTRQQGGQAIGKYQSVANRIADMKLRLETARLFLYKAAWQLDQGGETTMTSALAKLVISELFMENSLDAIRQYGGRGYLSEFSAERDLRDAIGGVLYAGTSDIQRNIIAGLMGL
jgi:hypothetical protein